MIGAVRHLDSAEVADVLAERDLAVDLDAGQRLELRVLVHELLRARVEAAAIGIGPPAA